MQRLKEKYLKDVMPALQNEFTYKSPMQIPHLTKIVLNMGVGEALTNIKLLDNAIGEMKLIAGQQPVMRRAHKSISNFKLRKNMPIGCSVTIRGERMYEFLERFINIAVPRIRDFRGFPQKGFDGRGNYSLGIKEQIIFPEIDYDKVENIRGMNITIVTTAKTDSEAFTLLKQLGFPFRTK
ncbi:MAG: 50S ribosomal protein L5 [Candidatus Delongbacteria bacterium]|nr:50S ribosomal protein L5 [Candidatus Delongbacteria bacterium]